MLFSQPHRHDAAVGEAQRERGPAEERLFEPLEAPDELDADWRAALELL
jgi:hypothetical protein